MCKRKLTGDPGATRGRTFSLMGNSWKGGEFQQKLLVRKMPNGNPKNKNDNL